MARFALIKACPVASNGAGPGQAETCRRSRSMKVNLFLVEALKSCSSLHFITQPDMAAGGFCRPESAGRKKFFACLFRLCGSVANKNLFLTLFT